MQSNAVLSCLLLIFQNVCCYQDNWIEPDAWSELTTGQFSSANIDSCQCQVQTPAEKSLATIEDQLALMYFKKFVNSLFSRKKLKYGKTSELFKRSMLFTIHPSQVDELEAVQDVRDLDIMLSKILDEAKDMPFSPDQDDDYAYTHGEIRLTAFVMDTFKDILQIIKKSEVKFILTVLLIIATGWTVHRRFRYSVVAIIIGGIFLFGYFFTYIECNRKLEIMEMIEVMESHEKPADNAKKSLISQLFGYFINESPEIQRNKKLLKAGKLNIPYCKPDDVLIMYMSDLFLKHIRVILENTTESIKSLNSGLSFPYNIMAPIAFVFLTGYLIKLIFKYVISPKAWMGIIHGRSSGNATYSQQQAVENESVKDRLSGENLKMILNVIGNSSIAQSQQQLQQPVSGVQELLEPLEALPEPPQSKSNQKSNQPTKEDPNVRISSTDIPQAAVFTVVDDINDDSHLENF